MLLMGVGRASCCWRFQSPIRQSHCCRFRGVSAFALVGGASQRDLGAHTSIGRQGSLRTSKSALATKPKKGDEDEDADSVSACVAETALPHGVLGGQLGTPWLSCAEWGCVAEQCLGTLGRQLSTLWLGGGHLDTLGEQLCTWPSGGQLRMLWLGGGHLGTLGGQLGTRLSGGQLGMMWLGGSGGGGVRWIPG